MDSSPLRTSKPRLALPYTVVPGRGAVRLVAGEDHRYSLSGDGLEDWLPGLLIGCDGRRSIEELLASLDDSTRHDARDVIERLYGERVLVDGPVELSHEPAAYSLVVEGTGPLAGRLARAAPRAESNAPALPVFCQDRLDYAAALEFNGRCLRDGSAWLWATIGPMSRGYVGPPFLPGSGPCWACLLGQFRRLSPAPELYDILIDRSRRGGSIAPASFPATGVEILAQLVLWKCEQLGRSDPPPALYRLHVLELESMEVTVHRVLIDPECPECGTEATMAADWAESRYTGLFTELGLIPARPHDPDVAIWGGLLAPCGVRSESIGVGGAGWTRESARSACLGEAIERWQAYPVPVDRVVEARFDAWPLEEPAVAPAHWVLFSGDQYDLPGFPFRAMTPQSACRWVCCRRFPDGEAWWVPEDLVFLHPRAGSVHGFGPSVSTGLSSGRPGQPVLLRGVQEVIERDALMGAWWGRYPLVEWEPEQVFGSLDPSLHRRLVRPNLRYRFYHMCSPYTSHATVVTLEGEDREGYCFGAGSACRETRRESWLKSILEAVQGRHYVRRLKAQRRDRGVNPADRSPPVSFLDHAVYYSVHPEELAGTVLHRAGSRADLGDREGDPDQAEDLDRLVVRLGPEHPVLFRNLTPPAVSQGPGDWYVLRVLVPGLQPMHGDHRLPFLGGPLWGPRSLADWWSMPPHPFP